MHVFVGRDYAPRWMDVCIQPYRHPHRHTHTHFEDGGESSISVVVLAVQFWIPKSN